MAERSTKLEEIKICENIKFLREDLGITQKELGEMIGRKESAIGWWEQGRSYPTIDSIYKLSKIFELSIDTLVKVDLRNADLSEFI